MPRVKYYKVTTLVSTPLLSDKAGDIEFAFRMAVPDTGLRIKRIDAEQIENSVVHTLEKSRPKLYKKVSKKRA